MSKTNVNVESSAVEAVAGDQTKRMVRSYPIITLRGDAQ